MKIIFVKTGEYRHPTCGEFVINKTTNIPNFITSDTEQVLYTIIAPVRVDDDSPFVGGHIIDALSGDLITVQNLEFVYQCS